MVPDVTTMQKTKTFAFSACSGTSMGRVMEITSYSIKQVTSISRFFPITVYCWKYKITYKDMQL
jgi:hypothetical protein